MPNQTRKQNAGQFPATVGKRAPPSGLEPELLQLFLVLIFPLSTYSSKTQTRVYSRHAPSTHCLSDIHLHFMLWTPSPATSRASGQERKLGQAGPEPRPEPYQVSATAFTYFLPNG